MCNNSMNTTENGEVFLKFETQHNINGTNCNSSVIRGKQKSENIKPNRNFDEQI